MFDFFFSIAPFFFGLFFFLFTGVFVFILVRGLREWNKNNHAPRLTVPVKIVAKRMSVSHSHNQTTHATSTHTTYYVTFEVSSGDRMELVVPGGEYGMMAEGDSGDLTFQGTRYLSFVRTPTA